MLSGAESKGKPDCAGLMVDADKCSTLRRKKKNLHLRIDCINSNHWIHCAVHGERPVRSATSSKEVRQGVGGERCQPSHFAGMERKQSMVKVWFYPQGYTGLGLGSLFWLRMTQRPY